MAVVATTPPYKRRKSLHQLHHLINHRQLVVPFSIPKLLVPSNKIRLAVLKISQLSKYIQIGPDLQTKQNQEQRRLSKPVMVPLGAKLQTQINLLHLVQVWREINLQLTVAYLIGLDTITTNQVLAKDRQEADSARPIRLAIREPHSVGKAQKMGTLQASRRMRATHP